jgi:hypothetical protein
MSSLLTPITGPMASQRQIEANKRNAQKSTGPRTDEGKKKVALNALKHGLLARHVVLPNEDEREFSEFSGRLNSELRPDGELEDVLVETIAACAWRLRRIVRIEKGLFIAYVCEKARPKGQKETQKARENETVTLVYDMKQDFAAEHARADEAERRAKEAETRAEAAEQLVQDAEAVRAAGDGEMGRAFMADAEGVDAFTRLTRYEVHIQRSMFRALEELRRMQAARASIRVSAPLELETNT